MITEDIRYIGVNDHDIDLFEGQYQVPNGISYNSYVIMDEKIAIMDTVDKCKQTEFLENLETALAGRTPDYLVISHMEPDHASSIQAVVERYPEITLVGNAKTFPMLKLYFDLDTSRALTVKEGDTLKLGRHELTFVMAPMVHWPEVMVSYDSCDKVLFSADGFGKFGALDVDEDWDCEARRYYFNIVGKYGMQVQTLLKKVAGLEIQLICPLHGPVLKETIGHVLEKYQIWRATASSLRVYLSHMRPCTAIPRMRRRNARKFLRKKDARRWQSRIWRAVIWRRRWKMHSGMEKLYWQHRPMTRV